jgi:tetraacyldisaccharide 4'-kinase
MQPPRFWYDDAEGRDRATTLQLLLQPVSWIYAAAAQSRARSARPVDVLPAVCVGNLTLGGAGKTPIVRALRAKLAARGLAVHTLSRGYGGKLKGPLQVDPARHTAADVGDEPLLHARDGPAWIGADRVVAATAAKAKGAQALVLDDGFQNTGLRYTRSILVFDAVRSVGNGRIFPAGPLREPLAGGLKRADAVVLMRPAPGAGDVDPRLAEALSRADVRTIDAWLEPAAPPPDKPLFAFAGIGDPDKFFAMLERLGARLAGRVAFPDHHPYSERDMTNLAIDASTAGARLITTEKDSVRIGGRWKPQVSVLPVVARFSDEAAIDALLAGVG